MPGKSRHGKGKHTSRRKRRGEKQHSAPVAARQQPVTKTREPEPAPRPVTPTPPPVAKRTATQYPYIAAEVRTIGILAGILVAILVVLYFVLP